MLLETRMERQINVLKYKIINQMILGVLFGFLALYLSLGNAYAVAIQESDQRFHPVVGDHGMVATQEKNATLVGVEILKRGGNAIDAAVAVGFALAVTLPKAGNLGGGGFMMIKNSDSPDVVALNYREKAPISATKDMYLDKNGEVDRHRVSDTYLASGVPGTVAGMLWAHHKYGKLSLKEVMAPAISLAENGFVIEPYFAESLAEAAPRLKNSNAASSVFFKVDGSLYQAGEILKQPDLANTLKLISKNGRDAFYKGKIAELMVDDMKQHGGIITMKDMEAYQVTIEKPIKGIYRGYTIYSMPPPSSGGITMVEILNILEGYPMAEYGLNSAKAMHVMTEAFNYAYNDRNTDLGDPLFVKNPTKKLTSKQYAESIRQKIDLSKHTPSSTISKSIMPDHESTQTTHYSIIDNEGNVVSNTYTLNYSYGNAKMVKGAGFLLNNEMDDFTAKVGAANAYGLVQGEANAIEPQKRPLSSMSPTIMIGPKGTLYATGSPGGSRIITTVLQVILNIVDYRLDLQSAVSMPRMHSQLWPDEIMIEQGFSADTVTILESMGHQVMFFDAMGSAQTAKKSNHGFKGAADPRRMGAYAEGY